MKRREAVGEGGDEEEGWSEGGVEVRIEERGGGDVYFMCLFLYICTFVCLHIDVYIHITVHTLYCARVCLCVCICIQCMHVNIRWNLNLL